MTSSEAAKIYGMSVRSILKVFEGMELDRADGGGNVAFSLDIPKTKRAAFERVLDGMASELRAHEKLTDEQFNGLLFGELLRRAFIANGRSPAEWRELAAGGR